MNSAVEISVVMATYNRCESLKNQINCLFNQSFNQERFELIIINDGSTDDTEAYLQSLSRQIPQLKYLLQQNRGPAAARNLGVSQAQGSIIAFTDDDCLADPDWLCNIYSIFRDKDVLAIQGKTVSDKSLINPLTHQVVNETGDTSIPTCNAAYRKETFISAGGFDESFPFQNEDADLAWRVREMGKVVFAPEVLMLHPPRQDKFANNAKKMKHYISEFMLFHKNPMLYRKYRCSGPWELIYWKVMVKAQGYHFLTRIKFARQPKIMLLGFALSLIWWGDLFLKIPVFWKAERKYRKLYQTLGNKKEFAPTHQKTKQDLAVKV